MLGQPKTIKRGSRPTITLDLTLEGAPLPDGVTVVFAFGPADGAPLKQGACVRDSTNPVKWTWTPDADDTRVPPGIYQAEAWIAYAGDLTVALDAGQITIAASLYAPV